MTENDRHVSGLELRMSSVHDEQERWYVHAQYSIGMLSMGIAIPVDATPAFVKAQREMILAQYRETLSLAAGAKPDPFTVVQNKLFVPGVN